MDELLFKTNFEEIKIAISNYKIFFGSNFMKFHKMFKVLEQLISKKNDSDFFKNCSSVEIKLNNQILSSNNTILFRLNPYFNIENDLKLGTKSLLLKYYELTMDEIDYAQEIDDLNEIIKIINDRISENSFQNFTLNNYIENFSINKLIKFINTEILINNYKANAIDLEYDDVLVYQLKIINSIALATDKNVFIIYEGYLSNELLDYIKTMNSNNIKILIYTNFNHKFQSINNYCFINNIIIDFFDDISVYNELVMSLPYHVEKEQFEKLIKDYIEGIINEKTIELRKICK